MFFLYSTTRNNETDNPVIAIVALVGNDVCNGHDDTLDRQTTPQAFYDHMLTTMQHLDSVLPQGSTVFWSGEVDGRILYGGMHDKTHPLGEMYQNVRYKDLYDYLNCLEISPCMGWLTTNGTLREATSKRAREQTLSMKAVQFGIFGKIFVSLEFGCGSFKL